MPYRSEKQRRYLHAQHPEIAAKWDAEIRSERKKRDKVSKSDPDPRDLYAAGAGALGAGGGAAVGRSIALRRNRRKLARATANTQVNLANLRSGKPVNIQPVRFASSGRGAGAGAGLGLLAAGGGTYAATKRKKVSKRHPWRNPMRLVDEVNPSTGWQRLHNYSTRVKENRFYEPKVRRESIEILPDKTTIRTSGTERRGRLTREGKVALGAGSGLLAAGGAGGYAAANRRKKVSKREKREPTERDKAMNRAAGIGFLAGGAVGGGARLAVPKLRKYNVAPLGAAAGAVTGAGIAHQRHKKRDGVSKADDSEKWRHLRGRDRTGEVRVNYDRSTKRNINRQTTRTTKWNPHHEFERVTTTGRQPTRWKVHRLTENVETNTRPDSRAYVQTNSTRVIPGRLTPLGRGAAIGGGVLGAGALGGAGYVGHKKRQGVSKALDTGYGQLVQL